MINIKYKFVYMESTNKLISTEYVCIWAKQMNLRAQKKL